MATSLSKMATRLLIFCAVFLTTISGEHAQKNHERASGDMEPLVQFEALINSMYEVINNQSVRLRQVETVNMLLLNDVNALKKEEFREAEKLKFVEKKFDEVLLQLKAKESELEKQSGEFRADIEVLLQITKALGKTVEQLEKEVGEVRSMKPAGEMSADTILELQQKQKTLSDRVSEILEWKKDANSRSPRHNQIFLAEPNPDKVEYMQAVLKNHGILPRTCHELKELGVRASGNYSVDPDGTALGDPPITVYCDMDSGVTVVKHDMDDHLQAGNCEPPGCFGQPVHYGASDRQLHALTENSQHCRQYVKYECLLAPLRRNGREYGWWLDRHGERHSYWVGAHAGSHVCQCALTKKCFEATESCNCDSLLPLPLSDEGYITNKTALPITELRFGHTFYRMERANFSLGHLECQGKHISRDNTCLGLRSRGVSTSGYYIVDGTQGNVDVAFCNMSLPSGDPHLQVDQHVLQPVAFSAKRNIDVWSKPGYVVSYDVVSGPGISKKGYFTCPLAGMYLVSFSGACTDNCTVALTVNGDVVGSVTSKRYVGYTLVVTLEPADRVAIKVTAGDLSAQSSAGKQLTFSGYRLGDSG